MRSRNVQIKFYLTTEEVEFLEKKMQAAGTKNKSAYLRKMALDGYIIHQNFSELKDFTIALCKIGNNLNQIAKVANTYGEVPISDVHVIEDEIMKVMKRLEKLLFYV
jgi:hypothetical protein